MNHVGMFNAEDLDFFMTNVLAGKGALYSANLQIDDSLICEEEYKKFQEPAAGSKSEEDKSLEDEILREILEEQKKRDAEREALNPSKKKKKRKYDDL